MAKSSRRSIHWSLKEPLEPRRTDETTEDFENRISNEITAKMDLLCDHYGIDRSHHRAGWHLAFSLAHELFSGLRLKKPTGVRPKPEDTLRDIVLEFGVDLARQENSKAQIKAIIQNLAKQNGWPTDDAHLETLRRRYYSLKRSGSRERRYSSDMVKLILPDVAAHFERKAVTKKK